MFGVMRFLHTRTTTMMTTKLYRILIWGLPGPRSYILGVYSTTILHKQDECSPLAMAIFYLVDHQYQNLRCKGIYEQLNGGLATTRLLYCCTAILLYSYTAILLYCYNAILLLRNILRLSPVPQISRTK